MDQNDTIRMQYVGVLQLLGNAMAYIPSDNELHESARRAFDDAKVVMPSLRVRQTLSRYDLEFET